MELRRRYRTRFSAPGRAFVNGAWFSPPNVQYGYDEFGDYYKKKRDIYGLLPASGLDAIFYQSNIVSISGRSGPDRVYGWPALPCWYNRPDPPWSHWSQDKGDSSYLAKLISNTNPFRTHFSIPVMAKELIDIASMFRFIHKSIGSTTGSAYLNYRFGWESFLRDLKTFGGITKTLERRLKELTSLLSSGGLRRKVNLDSFTTTWDDGPLVVISAPAPLWLVVKPKNKVTTKVWGTCRWFPAPGAFRELEDMSPLETFNLALSAVFDLRTPSPETVWNMIPWTWLIDYFVEIGPRLAAISNTDLATAEYCCIMRTTKWKITSEVLDKNSWTNVSGQWGGTNRIIHRRVMSNQINLPTSLLFFNESQAKVILALLLKLRG